MTDLEYYYIYRSAVTGKFVKKAVADADPDRHVSEKVYTGWVKTPTRKPSDPAP